MGLTLLPIILLTATTTQAQNRPQVKVDFSMGNRQDDQVVEPGFTAWKVCQGKTDTLTVDGIRFSLSVAPDAPCELQAGWNKTLILNAENREKNGRLTFDGVCVSITSVVELSISSGVRGRKKKANAPITAKPTRNNSFRTGE